jgi:Uncharacterised conserved protein
VSTPIGSAGALVSVTASSSSSSEFVSVNVAEVTLVCETLREVAEVLVWGDSKDAALFDYFLEAGLLGKFFGLLEHSQTARAVKRQLLQTLSLLLENLKSKTSVYFILSNNRVNEFILHRYDFQHDDELLAYYISLLKTLALNLDSNSLQFFFNPQAPPEHRFPLFTSAVRYFAHCDNMVRTAVRALTLSVFRLEEESVRDFLVNGPGRTYFEEMVICLASQATMLRGILALHRGAVSRRRLVYRHKLAEVVPELVDTLYFVQDLLALDVPPLVDLLLDLLLEHFFVPVVVEPLLPLPSAAALSSLRDRDHEQRVRQQQILDEKQRTALRERFMAPHATVSSSSSSFSSSSSYVSSSSPSSSAGRAGGVSALSSTNAATPSGSPSRVLSYPTAAAKPIPQSQSTARLSVIASKPTPAQEDDDDEDVQAVAHTDANAKTNPNTSQVDGELPAHVELVAELFPGDGTSTNDPARVRGPSTSRLKLSTRPAGVSSPSNDAQLDFLQMDESLFTDEDDARQVALFVLTQVWAILDDPHLQRSLAQTTLFSSQSATQARSPSSVDGDGEDTATSTGESASGLGRSVVGYLRGPDLQVRSVDSCVSCPRHLSICLWRCFEGIFVFCSSSSSSSSSS